MGNPDLSEFDRVEVLRGADALFGGNGNPGGTVSLVRKRPRRTGGLDLSLIAGSWGQRRVEVDATGPLALAGDLRGRIDASYTHPGFFYDSAERDMRKIFAVVEYDFNSVATITTGGSYQLDDALPVVNGLPLYADGRDSHLPRNIALTAAWANHHSRQGEFYLQYRQSFGNDWSLKLNTSTWRTRTEYGLALFYSSIDPVTETIDSPDAVFTNGPNTHCR